MSPPSLEHSHPLATELHESLALLLSHMPIALRLHLQKTLSHTKAMYVQHWKLGRKKNIRKNIKAYIQKNDCWYSGFYLRIDCLIILLKQTFYLYFWFFGWLSGTWCGFICFRFEVDPQGQVAGCLTSLSLSMVSFLTGTRFFSGTDGLFILPLAFHPPVPSSPPHPAHLLDSTSRYKTWHKNMISGCIILSSPNDLLHLFSAYCLTQHYDLRPKHVALYLSTSFLLTAAPCYTVGITCLFDLFAPQ